MGSHAVNSSCLPLLFIINYYANYAMYVSVYSVLISRLIVDWSVYHMKLNTLPGHHIQ
jgi:hypothetical protein